MKKQAKFKLIGIIFLILLFSVISIFALTISGRTPSDGTYDLDGTDLAVNVTATTNASTVYIVNISFWTNIGTWSINQTYPYSQATERAQGFVINAIPNASIADGTDVKWAVQIAENTTSNPNVTLTWNGNNTGSIIGVVGVDTVIVYNNGTRINQGGNYTFNSTAVTILNASPEGAPAGQSQWVTNAINVTYTYTSITFSTNYTINVEYPALVRLNLPSTNSWTNALQDNFNFTVNSSFTSTTLFPCSFWTNESGTWSQALGSLTATNGTQKAFLYQPSEGTIVWGIRCQQGDDGNVLNTSINFTLNIDRTLPVVSITQLNATTISNNTFLKTQSPIINYSITEIHRDTCILFVNNTANSTTTATSNNFTFGAAQDGVYNFLIGCNDTANNWKNSSTYQVTLDTVPPKLIEPHNVSTGSFADRRSINFSTDEFANATIYYGVTVDTGSSAGNSSFLLGHNITISGFEQNTLYYFNISVCDRAANCNNSGVVFGQYSFVFPFKLFTGWSYYGIYDSLINFSTILSQTNSEYVYYWNQTAQSWVSATAGGTTSMEFQVGTGVSGTATEGAGRHVVAIFESLNSTWERNITAGVSYRYNLTVGDNFLKMFDNRSMGQLGRSFLNGSLLDNNITYGAGPLMQTPEVRTYNMSRFYFSAYNNTATDWEINHVYNSTINNNTYVGNYTIHEVVWVFSSFNLTWNGSIITGNWTRI